MRFSRVFSQEAQWALCQTLVSFSTMSSLGQALSDRPKKKKKSCSICSRLCLPYVYVNTASLQEETSSAPERVITECYT